MTKALWVYCTRLPVPRVGQTAGHDTWLICLGIEHCTVDPGDAVGGSVGGQLQWLLFLPTCLFNMRPLCTSGLVQSACTLCTAHIKGTHIGPNFPYALEAVPVLHFRRWCLVACLGLRGLGLVYVHRGSSSPAG
jgi:hypothetical protein